MVGEVYICNVFINTIGCNLLGCVGKADGGPSFFYFSSVFWRGFCPEAPRISLFTFLPEIL